MLQCAHIGEVQHGWWNPVEVDLLKNYNIRLLGLGEFVEDPMAASLHKGVLLQEAEAYVATASQGAVTNQ
jgi:hypothetical protein